MKKNAKWAVKRKALQVIERKVKIKLDDIFGKWIPFTPDVRDSFVPEKESHSTVKDSYRVCYYQPYYEDEPKVEKGDWISREVSKPPSYDQVRILQQRLRRKRH